MRSPVLGFNHNLKHLGIVFHVQTEDSGVQNPHIMTHLFHGGGILGTKKMVYDPASSVDIVKALMQAQHKSVLKELKAGKFDDKIAKYFGSRGETLEDAARQSDAQWQVHEPGADLALLDQEVEADGQFTEPALDIPPPPVRPHRPPSGPPPVSGVVVSRPAVIIGAPPVVVGGRASPGRDILLESDQVENIFGQDLISEKSLDEVILAYLSEDSQED